MARSYRTQRTQRTGRSGRTRIVLAVIALAAVVAVATASVAAAVNPFTWVGAHLPWNHDSAPTPTALAISTGVDATGTIECRPTVPAGPTQPDTWDYTPVITADAGLALTKLRYGPRLLADAIDVPYVRVTDTNGKVHTVHLTPRPASGPNLDRVSLLSPPTCHSDDVNADQAIGVTATYRVLVNEHRADELAILIQQSYRFALSLDDGCEPTLTAQCIRFWPTTSWAVDSAYSSKVNDKVAANIVERFRLNPDDGSHIAAPGSGPGYSSLDLIRDSINPSDAKHLNVHVEELGKKGQVTQAGATKVLDKGKGGHWENVHQTARQGVELPGITPGVIPGKYGGGTAGCPECVHAHWTWFADEATRVVANPLSCLHQNCWSDGKPQILDGSEQTVCLGWDTGETATAIDWCDVAEQKHTGSATFTHSMARNKPPVFYYDARSNALSSKPVPVDGSGSVRVNGKDYAYGDSYWPYLAPHPLGNPNPHGGNGSFFFAPARKFSAVVDSVAEVTCYIPCTGAAANAAHRAMIAPRFPATQTADGKWMLKVDLATGDPNDRGPYYLRVRAAEGLTLLNPDPLYRPEAGGAPWVDVYDEGATANADDLARTSSWHPVATVSGNPKPMTAVLLFDTEPAVDTVNLQLDAAPDGVDQYEPSDGILPAPAGGTGASADQDGLKNGQTYAFIMAIKGQEITYDEITWFTGQAAVDACAVDKIGPVEGEWCNDFYYRNKNPRLRTATIPPDAKITYYLDYDAETSTVTGDKLSVLTKSVPGSSLRYIGDNDPSNNPRPYIITADGEKVSSIEQVYLP